MANLEAARARLLRELAGTIGDERVLDAIAQVPRSRFVPEPHRAKAYDDAALPLAVGQTISQPTIVAIMTQALALTGEERILEVGTGSGYQAALLSRLAKSVVTVERHATLLQAATEALHAVGADNVEVHLTTETLGWPAAAPYDAIIVTAAAPQVPQALLDQLQDGGRLVIPVGPREQQELLLVTKNNNRIERRSLGPCRFVPLIGAQAWPAS